MSVITLLGTTLWSELDPRSFNPIENTINDFNKIYITSSKFFGNKSLDHLEYLEWYHQDVRLLSSNLVQSPSLNQTIRIDTEIKFHKKPIWVLSHHLPTYKCISENYIYSNLNSSFVSDLDYLIEKVDVWIFGHTHVSIDLIMEKKQVLKVINMDINLKNQGLIRSE